MTNLIKISDAAKRLGITRQRMYQIIAEKELETVVLYGVTLINEDKVTIDLLKRKDKKFPNTPKTGGIKS